MDPAESATRVTLPAGPSGVWREITWVCPTTQTLLGATLEVTPPEAFRQLRVRRLTGEMLANHSWDQSRTRGIRLWPANREVRAGETLRLEAIAWWDQPVALTARLLWRKDPVHAVA